MYENTWKTYLKWRSSLFTTIFFLYMVGVSEQDFRLFWLINGLFREVSVPRSFLNDTNLFYIFHVSKHIRLWGIGTKALSE